MADYNSAFFSTHESYFLILKEREDLDYALTVFRRVMERNLKQAYDQMEWERGSPQDFARVLKTRDQSVGLHVKFPEVSEDEIVYQFHTDPFPNLKGEVAAEKLDATYLEFKVRYLLGEGWTYTTTKHLWWDDQYTEHVIEKDRAIK